MTNFSKKDNIRVDRVEIEQKAGTKPKTMTLNELQDGGAVKKGDAQF